MRIIKLTPRLVGVLLGVLLAGAAAAPCTNDDQPTQSVDPSLTPSWLAECLREGQEADEPRPLLTWDRNMQQDISNLLVRRMWWSTQRSNLPITVVTQLSTGRLPQLEAQCRSWPGPLSAAVYVPLIEIPEDGQDGSKPAQNAGEDAPTAEELREHTLYEVQAAMAVTRHAYKSLATLVTKYERQLGEEGPDANPTEGAYLSWEQPEEEFRASSLSAQNKKIIQLAERAVAALLAAVERQPLGCQLSIVLTYEVLGDVRTANLLYPVNTLRNYARLQSRTELVAQLDVDMLIGWDAAAWLRTGRNMESMIAACRNQSVYIMPAFEVHASDVDESAAMSDKYSGLPKSQLEKAVETGLITHFAALHFPQGHNTTDFPRWFKSSEEYPIDYTYRLEPWLIVHRTLAPWHDVRFRGYGNNKMQQVLHLNASDYQFLVHPAAFIIHRAHPPSNAKLQLTSDQEKLRTNHWRGFNGTLYGHNELMLRGMRVDMEAGTFAPLLDAPTKHCMEVLPWMAPPGGKALCKQQGKAWEKRRRLNRRRDSRRRRRRQQEQRFF